MQNQKYKAAIIGASGFTGSELARILSQHPQVEIKYITSESHQGRPFSDLHPQFLNIIDQALVSAEDIDVSSLDVIFLALPHGVSMDFVKKWKDSNCKIIDLSGDFRLASPEVYEAWYGKPHTYVEGFEGAAYGQPELFAEDIKRSSLIANPGCYPTASILSLAPLFFDNMVQNHSVVIDAKSGLTGAGVKASDTTHFSNVNENFKAYGVGVHRHTIEIEEQFSHLSDGEVQIQFTPHLLPIDRGILVTSYAKTKKLTTQEELLSLYQNFYADKPFVRVKTSVPSIKDVRGSHFCDIYPFWDKRTQRVVAIAAIDNLLKGAASQAVHNMNLVLGIEETAGLNQIPLRP
ncbi:N-acetyl-gamma-glutamyl-phosphate reductase [Belliella kenyensis]|uniref:N-acetyl-gamma-glutamyl-phosphate reductase n=1 Tax=Belliella kenyensis TaxID=1472724 RepID=A0ABV8EM57_9BACT|nr:N-acetyl-gamma-glutamyl-phosphate reductase [Belliella kenyensis]MCH7401235.1 N-acetyl-gamma-glutamyl-phosphate reductase [Belliella kenyensis]MDN3602681.1 N-acetyl-gamma-glutamyl-phosphate reductase [Belliella kenyensis]